MTLETFFEKFDQFADAPDAVAKMRELVLELAVRGRLVDQDQKDEPADKLLERIQKSKERLIKERSIRRQETDSIDCDSAPFPIPQSWVWTRLGEIGDWGSGSTPPRGNHDLYDGGITWLKSGELNDNLALASSSETVTELALKTGSFRRNQPGDVLFAMYGATIGKVAILAEPALTNQAVCGCTPFEGVVNRYLFNYLFSQRTAFHEASEGGAQPNLSKIKIVAFPFPLPPLDEQKRIVAKVDELMALCDRLEAQQQERQTRRAALARAALARFADAPTPANLEMLFYPSPCPRASVRKTKAVSHRGTAAQSPSAYLVSPTDLRKSILTLAVQGLLVPHDPELADWETRKLKEMTTKIGSGSTPSGGKASYQETGVPLIRSMNVHFGGFIRHGLAFLNEEQAEKLKNVTVKADDVLLNITGASIGRVAIAPKDMEGARVNQHVCILRTTAGIIPQFLELFLASPVVQHMIDDVQVGATREALTKAMIEQFEIPVPPLAEQRRIVAKVQQLMVLVDALETQLADSRATGEKLLAALVAELTAGKESHAAA